MKENFPPTQHLSPALIFLQPRWEGQERVYPLTGADPLLTPFATPDGLRLTTHTSPWEGCAGFMSLGYLPPFDLVRQLHEEEVVLGEVAKRLWVLRGARRTCLLVREAGVATTLQVHQLKQVVQRWKLGVESDRGGKYGRLRHNPGGTQREKSSA